MLNDFQNKFPKFIISGLINTSLNILSMSLLIYFEVYYLFASGIGFIVGAFSGYAINFFWTFKENTLFMKKFYKYFIIQLMNLTFTIALVFLITEFLNLMPILGQLIAIIFTTLINFYLSSKFVFTKS
jgi:putative flippase GtrA